MKRMRLPIAIAAAAIFLLNPTLAYADVDLLRGSYRVSFVDTQIGTAEVKRTYDSRSTYNGIFGFGWCSPFEKLLVKGANDQWILQECGRKTSESLQQRLRPIGDHLLFNTSDGARWEFNSIGLLVSYRKHTHAPRLRLIYDDHHLLRSVVTGEGKEIRFVRDPVSLKVLSLTLGKQTLATYSYRNQELISNRNQWNNQYFFHYDHNENLTEINYPDRTIQSVSYDSRNDLIQSQKGRDGCIERYTFTNPQPLQLTARALKKCSGWNKAKVSEVRFTFRNSSRNRLRVVAQITEKDESQ